MTLFFVRLATLGPIGYLPAPGTCATVLTLPLVYWLGIMQLDPLVYLGLLLVFGLLFFYIINQALPAFKEDHDPSEIILDEVFGCLITFFAVPITFWTMLVGFVLFRFFDIVKPLGIKKCEYLFGAWGVLLDDCLAAVFAWLVLRGLLAMGWL